MAKTADYHKRPVISARVSRESLDWAHGEANRRGQPFGDFMDGLITAAAVLAACRKADDLGLPGTCGRPPSVIEPADISAIVYAAYLAAGWDAEPMEDEPVPAHDHHWTILGAQPHTPWTAFGKPAPFTITLVRCTACGLPDSLMLAGEWTLEDLAGATSDV